jgi:putative MATE family efflux protein
MSTSPSSSPSSSATQPTSPAPAAIIAPSLDHGRLTTGRLAGLSLPAAVWVLSWPILAESVLNSLVGLTDTVLAAGIEDGGAAADAVGGASYVLWFMGLIAQAVGVGATAIISRSVGAGRIAVANAAVGQSIILALAGGVVVGAMVAMVAAPVARLLALTPEATEAFVVFLRINALGVPLGAVLFSGIASARGAGDSLRPLISMLIVNGVNMVLSYLLSGVDLKAAPLQGAAARTLLENPLELDLGVRGIAWGTVVAYGVGALVMLVILRRGVGGVGSVRGTVRLRARWLRFHRTTMLRLCRIGIPNFFEMLGMWAGNFLVIMMVGWLGGAAGGTLGSHLIAVRLEAFSYLPGFAFGTAAATLVGQHLGARNLRSATRAGWLCALLAVAFMGAMGVVFITMPRMLTGLLTTQPTHLELVPPLLVIAGLVQIPFGVSIVLRSALRGAGDTRGAMWITWICTYFVRLPLAYALSGVDVPLPNGGVFENPSPIDMGLRGLWIGLCLEIVVRCAIFTHRYAKGHWRSARV